MSAFEDGFKEMVLRMKEKASHVLGPRGAHGEFWAAKMLHNGEQLSYEKVHAVLALSDLPEYRRRDVDASQEVCPPLSVTLGLLETYQAPSPAVTRYTYKYPNITKLLLRFFRDVSGAPETNFSTIQVNVNTQYRVHKDSWQSSEFSHVVTFGFFTGGGVWYATPEGTTVRSHLGTDHPGTIVHPYQRFVAIPTRDAWHATEPFLGTRYSIAYFTCGAITTVRLDQELTARKFGFPLATPQKVGSLLDPDCFLNILTASPVVTRHDGVLPQRLLAQEHFAGGGPLTGRILPLRLVQPPTYPEYPTANDHEVSRITREHTRVFCSLSRRIRCRTCPAMPFLANSRLLSTRHTLTHRVCLPCESLALDDNDSEEEGLEVYPELPPTEYTAAEKNAFHMLRRIMPEHPPIVTGLQCHKCKATYPDQASQLRVCFICHELCCRNHYMHVCYRDLCEACLMTYPLSRESRWGIEFPAEFKPQSASRV